MVVKNCLICGAEINRTSNTKSAKLRRGPLTVTCSRSCSKIYGRVKNYISCKKYREAKK